MSERVRNRQTENDTEPLEIILLERETVILDGRQAIQFGFRRYKNKRGDSKSSLILNFITGIDEDIVVHTSDREVLATPNLRDTDSKVTRVDLNLGKIKINVGNRMVLPEIAQSSMGRGILLSIQPGYSTHMITSGYSPEQVMHALTHSQRA